MKNFIYIKNDINVYYIHTRSLQLDRTANMITLVWVWSAQPCPIPLFKLRAPPPPSKKTVVLLLAAWHWRPTRREMPTISSTSPSSVAFKLLHRSTAFARANRLLLRISIEDRAFLGRLSTILDMSFGC